MKSLLVDALRQANNDESDQALSDSGSFDATSQDFESTANDEGSDVAGELALMATTNSLELPPESAEEEAAAAEAKEWDPTESTSPQAYDADVDHSVTIVGELPTPSRFEQMPRLAKFSPLLCVVLAAAVAGSWFLAQHLGASRTGLGAMMAEARPAHTPGVPEPELTSGPQPRFPFLQSEQRTAPDEVVQ